MMESAHSGEGHDLRRLRGSQRGRPVQRRVLAETEMRAIVVEVADVGPSEPNSVALVEYDHVIKQLVSTPTNPSLRDWILPGTAIRGTARLRTHRPDERHHGHAESRVSVEDQIARRSIEGERLPQLLDDPS